MKKILLMLFLTFGMMISVNSKEIVLSSDNTLILNQDFNDSSVTDLMRQATKLDSNLKSGYPLYLFLYTPGGSIRSGLELYEFFKGLNRPVHTITLFAASMGFQTVQHLGKRYILKYGTLMSHKARGGFSGEFGGGLSQLDSRYSMWLKVINMLDEVTVKRTNGKQTMKTYRASYDNELWLNGPEAVKKGYADEVVTVKCDSSLQALTTKTISDGYMSMVLTFSKCPLIIAPIEGHSALLTNRGNMTLDIFLKNNGKFGKDCREYTVRSHFDSYGAEIPEAAAELCAKDKSLTLEKIRENLKKKKLFFSRNLRDHVEYSY